MLSATVYKKGTESSCGLGETPICRTKLGQTFLDNKLSTVKEVALKQIPSIHYVLWENRMRVQSSAISTALAVVKRSREARKHFLINEISSGEKFAHSC